MTRRLLLIVHSKTGNVPRLVDRAESGARSVVDADDPDAVPVEVVRRSPFDIDAADLRLASAYLLATPANFGYMSGALKDLFDRTFYELGHDTAKRPWALIVKGDTDPTGAVRSVEPIVQGLGWRTVADHLVITGDVTDADQDRAEELGQLLAAGLAYDLF